MNQIIETAGSTSAMPAANKQSGPGVASFVLGLVSLLLLFVMIGIATAMIFASGGHLNPQAPTLMLVGLVMFLVGLLSLVGIGLGIAGVARRQRRKALAVVGLCMNIVAALLILGSIILGAQHH